jgi:hypothetical protein
MKGECVWVSLSEDFLFWWGRGGSMLKWKTYELSNTMLFKIFIAKPFFVKHYKYTVNTYPVKVNMDMIIF